MISVNSNPISIWYPTRRIGLSFGIPDNPWTIFPSSVFDRNTGLVRVRSSLEIKDERTKIQKKRKN
jgi:hypothetical protein